MGLNVAPACVGATLQEFTVDGADEVD